MGYFHNWLFIYGDDDTKKNIVICFAYLESDEITQNEAMLINIFILNIRKVTVLTLSLMYFETF